jgi:hypothetical protein
MVAEALEIDKATDTDFWRRAINEEMAKVKIAWKTNDGLTPQQQAREDKASELIGRLPTRDRMPYHIRRQDGLHKKGSLCCWRSYNHGTKKARSDDDLFKCCVTRRHTPRIPNCGIE